MLLAVGLGNPGPRYADNRHNIGFMAADAIAARHGFPSWRVKFHAEVAEATIGGTKVLLMKPTTYMNKSGQAVAGAARFYKVAPQDIVVFYDELDLAPGKVRVKTGGGAAGHNGIRSIQSHLGAGFRRVRLGIGHPGHKDAVMSHVLKDFAKDDLAWLNRLLDAAAEHFPLLVANDDSTFMSKVAMAVNPPAPKPAADGDGSDGDGGGGGSRVISDVTTRKPSDDES